MKNKTLPLRRKTIIGWLLASTFFLGLLGYEWIPDYLRGGWLFLLLLMMFGAFLRITYAVLVGLVFFLGLSVYFLYKMNSGVAIGNQLLLLLMTPFAPIGYSAILHNLDLREHVSDSLLTLKNRVDHEIIPLALLDTFIKSELAIFNRENISFSEQNIVATEIIIENSHEIEELLGDEEWIAVRIQILQIIEDCIDNGYHVFGDSDFHRMVFVEVANSDTDFIDRMIFKINANLSLKIKLDRTIYEPSVS